MRFNGYIDYYWSIDVLEMANVAMENEGYINIYIYISMFPNIDILKGTVKYYGIVNIYLDYAPINCHTKKTNFTT